MPCERKHIEAIEAAFRGLTDEYWPDLSEAMDAALAACDESPCASSSSEPDLSVVSPSNVIMPDGICPACGATGAHDCSMHRRLARAIDAIEREACRCFGSNELHDAIKAARDLVQP